MYDVSQSVIFFFRGWLGGLRRWAVGQQPRPMSGLDYQAVGQQHTTMPETGLGYLSSRGTRGGP